MPSNGPRAAAGLQAAVDRVASTTYPDLLAAVVDFVATLYAVPDPALGLKPISGIWSDFQPAGRDYPYVVAVQLAEESRAQTENFAAAGVYLSNLATGRMQFGFYATSKDDANALGDYAADVLTDTYVRPTLERGRMVALVQDRTEGAQLGDTGAGTPTVFARIVQVLYVTQTPE